MGKTEAEDEPKRQAVRRMSSAGWRQLFLCCVQADDDDVQVLDYEHQGLTDVPGEVFNHERTLEVLRLDCNQITDLPRPLFHCHGLKELWLSDNEISLLPPALASLIHLQVLDLSKNALTEIPDAISGLKALMTLDLSVNPLGKLPEGATKLLALESLNLSDTFLEFLPANFGRLTKLRLLELRENQLATLPKSMARLTALKRLDMGQNELTDLPEVIGSIPSLAELWLDGNKLDVLPDFIGHLQNLIHLDVCRNALHGIAPTIGLCKSLTDLSLTANNLAALPEEIGDLSQLTVLRVDDNRLTSLPDSIGRLSHLEELQAGQNRLTKLPASIGLLRKLETLMLNENLLEDLPVELGSCQKLTVLSLRKNKLENMPPEIGQLSRLRVVNLSCNRLLHLPVSFLKLPALAALWLSEAQTKPVVPLQTDTDKNTGRKVLTCFLLPQSTEPEPEESSAENDTPSVVSARTPTHIKFAFDGEADAKAGKLMRNPTPYPKELKALAKHAQHIQQHQSPSRQTSIEPIKLPETPVIESPTAENVPEESARDEVKEARVMRLEEEVKQPPPYHVAAAYSKRAAEFNQPLPRTQSTDSGFTADKTEARDSSPSRDSGRGPSIEPLEDSTPVVKRPVDLPMPLVVDGDTPLPLKRATYIVDTAPESPPPEDLQSVAALRQAARDVLFSASPKESPLPAHKWDAQMTNGQLSAANVVGLPPSENGPLKIQGRLPPPKYHVSVELKSPPVNSRIPLASHNRLPGSNLSRQGSNVSENDVTDAPMLPPKKEQQQPPTLLPKLSAGSRIPPPQVHTPTILTSPLTPISSRTSFTPLPVHSARLVTPTTPLSHEENGFKTPTMTVLPPLPTSQTRIPLPKYSASDLMKAGPSPISRIPTRLPTPTSATAPLLKSRLDQSASPALASAYSSRIQ